MNTSSRRKANRMKRQANNRALLPDEALSKKNTSLANDFLRHHGVRGQATSVRFEHFLAVTKRVLAA